MLPRGLLKEHSQLLAIVLRCLDVFAIVLAGWVAYYYRFATWQLTSNYFSALLVAAVASVTVFQFFQVYQSIRTQGFWQHTNRLIQAMFILLMCLAGLAFITKTGEIYSRAWFACWGIFSSILLLFFRGSLWFFLYFMRSHGWNERRVIVIGAGKLGGKLVERMHHALWTGFRVTTIFDDYPENKSKEIFGVPVVKTPSDMDAYLAQMKEGIDEIWLALPFRAEDRIKEILYGLRHHTITTRFVLDIFGLDLLNHSMTNLAGFPTLNLNASPIVGLNRLIKAIEDRIIAALILLLISPLFLLIAFCVKVSSKGPVFFKQHRHGWDGRIIKVYKFRTMIAHQEEAVLIQATENDKRITRLGRFLRKTSLDELPQFFNVLQGRMSIVGPRPHAISHNEYYKDSIKAYMQRHKVKPGITGWAQVNGFRGETDTLDKMRNRVEYDLYYIEHWSLFFDIKIIFLTFLRGFFSKNAY